MTFLLIQRMSTIVRIRTSSASLLSMRLGSPQETKPSIGESENRVNSPTLVRRCTRRG